MTRPTVNEDQFISLFLELGSPAKVAAELGITLRAVYERRQRLAEKGINLPTITDRAKDYKSEILELIISSRKDIHKINISDGIIIVGSDAHYSPGHIPVAHKALCNLLVDLGTQVKMVVLNGDILDGGQISRHPRIRWHKPPTVKQELEAVQQRLGDIEKARPAGCHLVRTYGNHCARFETRLANQVPEFEGVGGFLLKDHLPHWHDCLRVDVNDDCVIIHDWHSGIHSGWNDVLKGGCHTVTGHTHELSAKAHRGFKETHYGIKTGMLADESQDEFAYRQGKPGFNWQSGFAVLTWLDGMLLHPEFAAVRDDGNCYFRGKLYATP